MIKKIAVIFIVLLFALFVRNNFINNHINKEILLGDSNTLGDVDGNGKVNISDYMLIRKHILGTSKLNSNQEKRADVNRDNKINQYDYMIVRKSILYGTKIEDKKTTTTEEKKPTTLNVAITESKGTCETTLIAKVTGTSKLIDNAYSWDNQQTWTNESTLKITKIGTYQVYVKDSDGKIYSSEKYIVNNLAPPELSKGIISSSEFNIVKGSNITNETALQNANNFNKALQCAHNSGITSLKVENGQYFFNGDNHNYILFINFSNMTLDLNGSEFNVYPNNHSGYRLIQIGNSYDEIKDVFFPLENENKDLQGIIIKNGTLKGDRYEHRCAQGTWTCNTLDPSMPCGYRCSSDTYHPTHEFGFGIAVMSNDVTIENMFISEMTGDGIYIHSGFNITNSNHTINISNNIIEHVRRNGISLIGGKNINIRNNIIRYINGTAPQSGIDLEPNNSTVFYGNVLIEGNTIYGNKAPDSICVNSGLRGYLKIINNRIGDQIVDTAAGGISLTEEEKSQVTLSGNTVYIDSNVRNCVCEANTLLRGCNKCQVFCDGGLIINGTVKRSQWLEENGKWHYYDPTSGISTKGWKQIGYNGTYNWYYFDNNGVMQTGWQHLDWNGLHWFYFDDNTGAMLTGWHNLSWNGQVDKYHFNESGICDSSNC